MPSLFLNPQSGAGPSISSSVVLCSFVLLVCIVMLVLVFYLCPSSVRVVATFSGIVLFSLLYIDIDTHIHIDIEYTYRYTYTYRDIHIDIQ